MQSDSQRRGASTIEAEAEQAHWDSAGAAALVEPCLLIVEEARRSNGDAGEDWHCDGTKWQNLQLGETR